MYWNNPKFITPILLLSWIVTLDVLKFVSYIISHTLIPLNSNIRCIEIVNLLKRYIDLRYVE